MKIYPIASLIIMITVLSAEVEEKNSFTFKFNDIHSVSQLESTYNVAVEKDNNLPPQLFSPVSVAVYNIGNSLEGFRDLDKIKKVRSDHWLPFSGTVIDYGIVNKNGKILGILTYHGKHHFGLSVANKKNGAYYKVPNTPTLFFSSQKLAIWVENQIESEYGVKGVEIKEGFERIKNRLKK